MTEEKLPFIKEVSEKKTEQRPKRFKTIAHQLIAAGFLNSKSNLAKKGGLQ